MSVAAGSRILSGFANVLLERGLPRIKAWLRHRLGDAADLRSLRIDGMRAHLEGARLPLGRAELHVARATFELEATPAPRAQLVALDAVLRAEDGDARFEAPLALDATRPDDADAWVNGTLKVRGARWTQRRGLGDFEPLHGTVDVRVTLKRWRLGGGRFAGSAAEVWLDAEGAMDNSDGRALHRAHLSFKHARAGHLADALAALLALDIPCDDRVPWAALATGELSWTHAGRIEARVALADPAAALPDGLHLELGFDRERDAFAGSATLASRESSLRLSPVSIHDDGRLHGTLEGRVAAGDLQRVGLLSPAHLRTEGALSVGLRLAGSLRAPALDGVVRADRLELAWRERPDVPPVALGQARAELSLARDGIALTDLSATAWGGELRGGLDFAAHHHTPRRPWAALRLIDADASLLAHAGRVPRGLSARIVVAGPGTRPADEMWVSQDARVNGRLDLFADLAWQASLALETRESALLLELVADEAQRLDGSRVAGRVGMGDALLCGLFDTAIKPFPEGSGQLDARLEGTLGAPALHGQLDAGALRIDGAGAVALHCDRLRVAFVWDQEAFVWRDLVAEAYGGTIRGEGVVGFTEVFSGSDCDLEVCDLEVAALPTDRSGAALGAHLAGRARATLHLGQRQRRDPITGQGTLAIHAPEYPIADAVVPKLREVGLPPLTKHGTAPLGCRFALHAASLEVLALDATLEGCRLEGSGHVRFSGELDGRAALALHRDYLRKSALLALPSLVTGDVTLPITIRGALGRPDLTADLAGAVRRSLATGTVGSAVSGAARGVAGAMDGVAAALDDVLGGRQKRDSPARSDAELEALVERIMNDDPDTDRLIDALIDAGVSAEDIVRILERRRVRL